MRRLLRDTTLRSQLAHNARAWALSRGWEQILDGVIGAYREASTDQRAGVA